MPKPTKTIQLSKIDTRAHKSIDKDETKGKTLSIIQELDELQNLMYAEGKHSLLIVIQGMDASGKDGLIKDVFTAVNPQGIRVQSFKEPTKEELAHDFLWRIHKNTPEKGMIQVFNRSHYEDVLITRVHGMINDKIAEQRMDAINHFERLLELNNTHIIKLYLHVSHEEQHKRLEERLEIPRKMWKYNKSDLIESKYWTKYRQYYEEIFEKCNAVPWHIIPADQNWFKSYKVAEIVHSKLKSIKMKYPGLKKEI